MYTIRHHESFIENLRVKGVLSVEKMDIVTMSNILDVIGTFQRPLIEGQAVLDAKMLVAVERLRREDDFVKESYIPERNLPDIRVNTVPPSAQRLLDL